MGAGIKETAKATDDGKPEAEVEVKAGKKPRKIIWQSPRGPNEKRSLLTLNEINPESGRTIAHFKLSPNHVGQYIVEATAQLWEKQVEAMKHYAEKFGLVPIGEKDEGLIPKGFVIMPDLNAPVDEAEVTSLREALREAQAKNAELMAKVSKADESGDK
jgi:hypothetical protein